MRLSINKIKYIFLLILIGLSFIAVFALLHPGLPDTHDGKDHVARIANFYENLQQGILIPRWAPNLNWGYGHPVVEFLYPLPSYIASFFHAVGFSFVDATKFVYGIGIVFSGVAMYLWLAEFLSLPAAFVGGVLYMFTPYRFVEVYVRGDIGENLGFIFMPLTLYFIYRLFKHQKLRYVFYGSVSLACLILSHNALSLMYLPFILGYILYLVYVSKYRKSLLLHCCFFILLGFCLAAFFWIPGLVEGKYTLRNIVTAGSYAERFVSIPQLIYGPWSYGGSGLFTVQLGIVNWIFLLLAVFLTFGYWRRKENTYILIGGLLIYTIASISLMLPFSNVIWQRIILLQNFQFPWRFLAVPVFTTSALGAIVVAFMIAHIRLLPKKFQVLRDGRIFIVLLVLIILFLNRDYWHANGYLYKQESFYSGIYPGTTDTGESTPIWSIRFMEKQFTQPLEVISGKANITSLIRNSTKHVYVVNSDTKVQLRENTVYFPGWNVLVDGTPTEIQYQDPHNRGVMTFYVEKGKHIVTVSYAETKVRMLSDMISLLTLIVIVVWASRSYMTTIASKKHSKK